jgi:hypothetical protein
MIEFSLVGLSLLAAAAALLRWRTGIFLLILIGLVQDPLRKMVPGVPGYLVLAAVPVWSCMFAGALVSEDEFWDKYRRLFPQLVFATLLFVLSVIPAAVESATYSPGSWQVTLVGAFVYSSVLVGMVVGCHFPREPADIERVMKWYCLLCAVVLIGAPLERLGLGARLSALGTAAMGHYWMTYRMGYGVHMLAGFFRSPDVLGWHSATMLMFCLILVMRSRGLRRAVWMASAGWAGVSLMLCGRRKMITMIPMFVLIVSAIYIRRGKLRQLVPLAGGVALAAALGWAAYAHIGKNPQLEEFYLSTRQDMVRRVTSHGWDALFTTYRQTGFFGAGLGTATQGIHHLKVERPRTWQEGGPGKLLVELGVPGFVCFFAGGFVLLFTGWQLLKRASETPFLPVYAGLFGIVWSNAAAGIVSAQIFGDPFVAAFLPLLIGLMLSAARLPAKAQADEIRPVELRRATVPA